MVISKSIVSSTSDMNLTAIYIVFFIPKMIFPTARKNNFLT